MSKTKKKESQWATATNERLAEAGFRRGGARAAVVSLLDEQSCALSAYEIEDLLAARERAVGRGMSGAAFDLRDAAQHGLTEALLAAGGVEVNARGSVLEVAAAAGRALRLLCSTDEPHPDPAT